MHLFASPITNVIDQIIIVFIYSWFVSMVTNERESHVQYHGIMVALDFLQP